MPNDRGLFTAWESSFWARRVAIGGGPLTARIGFHKPACRKRAAENVLYHRVLPLRDRGSVRLGRGDRVVYSGRESSGLATDPGFGKFGGRHADISATESGAVGVGRDLRGVTVDDQQSHLCGYSTAGAGTGPLRARGRGVGARTAVHRGRDTAFLLVMGHPPASVFGQAQDDGHERSGRVHPRRRTRLDLRSDRGRPPRRVLPGRIRGSAYARSP